MPGGNDSPVIGQGDIKINIEWKGATEHYLRPTYRAAQEISRGSGGIIGATERLMRVDIDTLNQVICAGLGFGAGRPAPEQLREAIWKAGYSDTSGGLVDAAVRFCRVLAQGGKPVKDDGEDEDAEGGERKDPLDQDGKS